MAMKSLIHYLSPLFLLAAVVSLLIDIFFQLTDPAFSFVSLGFVLLSLITSFLTRKSSKIKIVDGARQENNHWSEVVEKILNTENSVRRLNSHIGDSISQLSNVGSDAVTIKNSIESMTNQVSQGASSMEEIDATIDSMANQIRAQKSLVDQSAAAIEQMSASVGRIYQVAEQKNQAASALLSRTNEGKAQVYATKKLIQSVGSSVEAIAEQIQTIHDIASRTNLLAMNAAIEAAHSGEHGKGFAVVATEVRNLAEGTEANAKTIAASLKDLLNKMKDALKSTEETTMTFVDISDGVQSVSQAFSEITTNNRELDEGAREILKSSITLANLSSEIAIGAEETKLASRAVTSSLVKSREVVSETAETMLNLGQSALNLNETFSKISTTTIEVNDQIYTLLESVEHASPTDKAVTGNALKHLKISTLILQHLNWMARARLVMMGKEDADEKSLKDHRSCALGQWLLKEGKSHITDKNVYDRLYRVHEKLHEIVRDIMALGTSDRARSEELFQDLSSLSRQIVEILSAYQEDDSIKWTEDLATKIPTIDKHHKSLFHLIDRLYQNMKAGYNTQVIKEVLDDLIDYTNYHFKAEEEVFNSFSYPDRESHKKQHDYLVERALQLRQGLESGQQLVAVETTEFLKNWITKHIKGCDMLYVNFFKYINVEDFLQRRAAYMASRKVRLSS